MTTSKLKKNINYIIISIEKLLTFNKEKKLKKSSISLNILDISKELSKKRLFLYKII